MTAARFAAICMALALAPLSTTAGALAQSPPASQASAIQPLEDRYAHNGDLRLHYLAAGKGPLVVMIHGFADYSATWRGLIDALGDSYRVAALDMRGVNLSDPPGEAAGYSISALLDDVAAVIAAEGQSSAVLIGHDLGGAVAWRFALERPAMTSGLAVLAMPHPAAYARDIATNPAQRAAHRAWLSLADPGAAASLSAADLAGWVADPALRRTYVETFERTGLAGTLGLLRANDPASAGGLADLSLNLPLLLVHGENDGLVLPSGHDGVWTYVSADSALLRVPGAGHFVHHDAPAMVNEAIRAWLDLHRR